MSVCSSIPGGCVGRVLGAAAVSALLLVSGVGPPAGGAGRGGQARLIAYELAAARLDTQMCLMPPAERRRAVASAAAAVEVAVGANATTRLAGSPARKIHDPFPAFAAIAVDAARGTVVMTDENLFQILVYDRRANAAPAEVSQPQRIIAGDRTEIEFQSGLYVDPVSGEIYAANNDTVDKLVVFARDAEGNVAPLRELETPHGTFGVTVDEDQAELFLTVQHDSAVVVYRKEAAGGESPVRLLQGDRTGLADPHGIALDVERGLMFVANYGSMHKVRATETPRAGVQSAVRRIGKANWPLGREYAVPGSGSISPPSITVHDRRARGNAPPLRTIQGPNTQLNWPTGLAYNARRGELYVANDMGPSILVFDWDASGNVAPKRVLKGPRTGLANPTDVFVDTHNSELWVANFGGHSATVYDLTAEGDTPPRRTIRSAPEDAPSLMIGNPGAVGYDVKRREILVPN